jgi:outer membrane autotransporter protein
MGNLGGGKQSATSLGLYGLGKTGGGSYAAGVLQASRYTLENHVLGGFSLKGHGTGVVGSIEAGHEFRLAQGVTLTPQAQLSAQQTSLGDANFIGVKVSYEDARSVTRRLGMKLAKTQRLSHGGAASGWLTLSAYDTTGNRPKASYSSDQLVSSVSEVKPQGRVVGVQTGFSWDMTRNVSTQLAVDYLHGIGDSPLQKAVAGSAKVQIRF